MPFPKNMKDFSKIFQVGKVEVLTIDLDRKRIALTARLGQVPRQTGNVTVSDRSKPQLKVNKPKAAFNHNPFGSL